MRPDGESERVRQERRDLSFLKKARRDDDEQKQLILRYQAGEPGMQRLLCVVHQPMLWNLAKLYSASSHRDLPDLFQEAKIAMLDIMRRFDFDRGGLGYIRNFVRYALYRYAVERLAVVRASRRLYTKKELRIGSSICKLFSDMPDWFSARDRESFEAGIEEAGPLQEETLGDQELSEVELEVLLWLLSRVPEKNRAILLGHVDGRTLKDVGEPLGLSRERIRQVCLECVRLMQREAGAGSRSWDRMSYDERVEHAATVMRRQNDEHDEGYSKGASDEREA